ncbi:MAG: hypothetical protein D6731_14530 [Planctomycetota bacterium]|nr:MAG: hypothetical protein D6731_14530 [Planctomycetota bacterium]
MVDLQPAGVPLNAPRGGQPSELPVRYGKLLKHAVDRLVAVGVLPFAVGPAALVAGLIKLEDFARGEPRASVFYRERRVSAGEAFDLLKFRVVRPSALAAHRARGGRTVKELEGDPQALSCVGRFLVDYYLDELPQLLHVLSGRMSLVGPRPVWPHDTRRLEYFRPFRIKAGLAGTFQLAKGTGDIFDLDRIYLREYARRGPLSLLRYDLSVLRATLRKMTRGEGL